MGGVVFGGWLAEHVTGELGYFAVGALAGGFWAAWQWNTWSREWREWRSRSGAD
jgi:hypothetical protein